ncbi:hypothetical protein AVEN_248787-1 [Araneus ventricosus]|uniref:Uncharacterized protein n=1 Tax=Araneus ventricosus TaxID=182803 RepID=A0A4Y2PN25_ARAVE|nr:hypothetical protein AVEN_248787-1 [Araneus ventricosus]
MNMVLNERRSSRPQGFAGGPVRVAPDGETGEPNMDSRPLLFHRLGSNFDTDQNFAKTRYQIVLILLAEFSCSGHTWDKQHRSV